MRHFIIVALITFSFLFRVQADPSPATETAWSEPVSGYQMRAMIDTTNGIVHCQVRNATGHALMCRRFQFGYVEFISLEIQDGTNWQTFHPAVGYPPVAWNAIPSTSQVLNPGEVVKSAKFFNREFDYGPYRSDQAENGPALESVNQHRAARASLLKKLCADDTFIFDLFDQSAVLDYFQTHPAVTARATQQLGSDASHPEILYSPALKLDADFIQNCLQQSKQLGYPLQLKKAQK